MTAHYSWRRLARTVRAIETAMLGLMAGAVVLLYSAVLLNWVMRLARWAFALLLMVLVLAVRPAAADDRPLPVWLVAGFGTALAIDNGSTIAMGRTIHAYEPHRQVERNPVIGWLEPHIGVTGEMVVTTAVEIAGLYLLTRTIGARHPRILRTIVAAGIGTHSQAAYGNLSTRPIYQRWARFYFGH